LKFYQKRKDWLLNSLKDKLTQLASKYYFVKGVVDETIIVSKRKKDNIIAQLEKIEKIKKVNDSYDYLLALSIYNLTSERLEELKKQIEDGKEEYKKIKETSIQDMWLDDLKELQRCF
jgi:DNA topoisomerase-2